MLSLSRHSGSLLCPWTLSFWCMGSVVEVLGLCCSAAYEILVPRPGTEPVSPALQGGFLTTGPSGSPWASLFALLLLLQTVDTMSEYVPTI